MFKVLVWDYVGISAQWLEKFADMKDIEVVGTIKPSAPTPKILLEIGENTPTSKQSVGGG